MKFVKVEEPGIYREKIQDLGRLSLKAFWVMSGLPCDGRFYEYIISNQIAEGDGLHVCTQTAQSVPWSFCQRRDV
jgi:hypothetical protein